MNHDRWSKGVLVSGSPDPEVTPQAKRRTFSAPYKKKILAETEAATGTGGIGEILRREGIYSSTLTSWRKERDAAVDGAFSRKRGPEPKRTPLTIENEKLRRRNQRLEDDLRKGGADYRGPQKTTMSGCTPARMKMAGDRACPRDSEDRHWRESKECGRKPHWRNRKKN